MTGRDDPEGKKWAKAGLQPKAEVQRKKRLWFGPDGLQLADDHPDIKATNENKDFADERFKSISKTYLPDDDD